MSLPSTCRPAISPAKPALDEADCTGTAIFGMEAIAGGIDLLCLGEMGIGNTTVAAAVSCALYGGDPTEWVGPGTGVDAAGLARKAEAVRRGLHLHRDHLEIRWRSCAVWAAASLPPWPAPFSPPASPASR